MSDSTRKEREGLAKDALILSAIRRDDNAIVNMDVKRLPTLSDAERAAMNALGSDFVERLLAGQIFSESGYVGDNQALDGIGCRELAFAGADEDRGLNRAEDMDDETTEERDRLKQEIIERKKREQEEKGGSGA
jgi:hypothetical protein